RGGQGGNRGRQRTSRGGDLALNRPHERLGFGGAAIGFKPAWRLGQRFAQIPDDQRTNPGNDEERAPPETPNYRPAENSGNRQTRDDDKSHEGHPFAASLWWHELGHRAIAHNDLRAEAETHHKAETVQNMYIGREGGSERCQAEYHQIELIGEAA